MIRESSYNLVGQTLVGGCLDSRGIRSLLDSTHGDIFRARKFIAHEVLENNTNLFPQVLKVVVANVDSVQKNLTGRRFVQARQELYDGCLSLAVFSHESDSLGGLKMKVNII